MEKYIKIDNEFLDVDMVAAEYATRIEVVKSDSAPDGFFLYDTSSIPQDVSDGYERTVRFHLDGQCVRRVFGERRIPRIFSKLKAVAVLTQAGYWERCKQFITDAGLYDLYLAAQDFREDNEYFIQGLAQIKTELGLTDEQVEAILAQCVDGETAS